VKRGRCSAGDTWTIPLGLNLAKVLKLGNLPVKVQLAGQYMVHHPYTFEQVAQIKLNTIPIIKSLIKEPIFGSK
jgi:hypothetical protein